jgi:hypothetical protein
MVNNMAKLKTYLVGSIQDSKDGGAGWREHLSKDLESFGFEVLNPCVAECNHSLAPTIEEQKVKLQTLKRHGEWNTWKPVMGAIVKNDLTCVISSEFIIVSYDHQKHLGGTIEEIVVACQQGIPIYTVTHSNYSDCNDWILWRLLDNGDRCGGKIFHSYKQLINFLSVKYSSYIQKHQDSLREQPEPLQ